MRRKDKADACAGARPRRWSPRGPQGVSLSYLSFSNLSGGAVVALCRCCPAESLREPQAEQMS